MTRGILTQKKPLPHSRLALSPRHIWIFCYTSLIGDLRLDMWSTVRRRLGFFLIFQPTITVCLQLHSRISSFIYRILHSRQSVQAVSIAHTVFCTHECLRCLKPLMPLTEAGQTTKLTRGLLGWWTRSRWGTYVSSCQRRGTFRTQYSSFPPSKGTFSSPEPGIRRGRIARSS